MATITRKEEPKTIVAKTQSSKSKLNEPSDWWNASTKQEMGEKLLATILFLKEQNHYRCNQASIYARLYGNIPLFGWAGTNLSKISSNARLPNDRPTMSVITSCVDTVVSRISQNKPRPLFLTDNSDYKQRDLAKQMNRFIQGELYQTKAYQLGESFLRDACVLGTGAIKVLEDDYQRVSLERRLNTELLVDPNDAIYGLPRQMYELKLVDRSVLTARFPQYASMIKKAEQAYPDTSGESSKTVSDLVLVGEGWHLQSGPKSRDGLHALVCSSGIIFDEPYEKKHFPFVFMDYASRLLGFWGQGLPERQMGTQVEINKLLMTISQSINLVGVPRVFVEKGSKVVKAHINNMIGAIVEYSGTKPVYEVAPCVPQEIYAQLQRLVMYAYEQEGISQLSASSQKPAGLNSGEAIRSYDDIQSDRFAALQKRYQNVYIDLSYQIIDKAVDIAKRDGKYQTVFPDKDGTREIDLPDFKTLLDDPFVIQCFDTSSLPKEPAGRLERVVEMIQSGMVDPQEGRRLLDFPDIEQVDKLANSGEERILKALDQIVDSGKYTPPDSFMDLDLALKLTTQYYNLYIPAKLEESKAQLLRDFFTQLQEAKALMMGPPPGAAPPVQPQANPEPTPQSDLIQNTAAQPLAV